MHWYTSTGWWYVVVQLILIRRCSGCRPSFTSEVNRPCNLGVSVYQYPNKAQSTSTPKHAYGRYTLRAVPPNGALQTIAAKYRFKTTTTTTQRATPHGLPTKPYFTFDAPFTCLPCPAWDVQKLPPSPCLLRPLVVELAAWVGGLSFPCALKAAIVRVTPSCRLRALRPLPS